MELEEETYKKFGYYSWDLSPKSNKKLVCACDECGKIRVIPKDGYHALCSFCSRKGERNPNWRGGLIKCFCKECGKEFKVKPYRIKDRGAKFCSQACQNIAQSKTQRGKNAVNWKGGKTKRVCIECGAIFFIPPAWIKKGEGSFCSQKCKCEYQIGEKHPAWKGGVSFEPYCSKFNNKFREYIRNKFDNICFLCNKTEEENGQRLSVHHVNYNKACGCADTEEDKKAEDESCQFVPLCRSCNSKVNKDRDKWEKYFKNKLRNKLNGWYI